MEESAMTELGIHPKVLRSVPTTMRAAVYERYGPPEEVLAIRTIPVPAVGPDEVLVQVHAASVNALDWHYTTGEPLFARISLGLRRPNRTIPGVDVSGTVAAVGVNVTTLRPGDEVFGAVDGGGFAEYVVAPAEAMRPKPASVGFEQAATIGVAAETALQGLRDWGRLVPGQRVLVNGASGGVGTFAVQLAKALGAAHVTAVCSTANVDTARANGADRVVDYTSEDFTSGGDSYDLMFDNAGSRTLRACRRVLVPGGTYVMVTAPKSRRLHPLPRMVATPIFFAFTNRRAVAGKVAQSRAADRDVVMALVEAGTVTPVMDQRYSLDEAPEALRRQGEFHARGKSVVVVRA
jgi:NADPH:quinone reductase-like Zn-dependent oxidoreductase